MLRVRSRAVVPAALILLFFITVQIPTPQAVVSARVAKRRPDAVSTPRTWYSRTHSYCHLRA